MLHNRDTARAIALLGRHGRIEVNILPKNEHRFRRLYKSLTGKNANKTTYNVATNPEKKGGDQLRLILRSKTEEDKALVERGLGITLGRGPGGHGWRKGDNDLCLDLIAAGLDIGGLPPREQMSQSAVRARLKDMSEKQREFLEGFKREISREVRTRNRSVVEAAKRKHGYKCKVCGFDFGEFYGPIGRGFVEGHHKEALAAYEGESRKVSVDDIVPVCSNCHRMLHKGQEVLSVERLKEILRKEGVRVIWPWD